MNEQIIELDPTLIPSKPDSWGHRSLSKRLSPLSRQDLGNQIVVRAEIPLGFYHRNYLDYLEICYGNHFSPVLRPDFIWYGLLCEIAAIVRENPEAYRDLFTYNPSGKSTILLPTMESDRYPMAALMQRMKDLIPSGVENYLPEFSTTTDSSRLACSAAFADAASPYYNYMMYLCGLPSIVIQGTVTDWVKLHDTWIKLDQRLFQGCPDYFKKVTALLYSLAVAVGSPGTDQALKFWKNIIHVENCGSGHQTQISGWITDLFRVQPGVSYAENFSSHVSKVDYKNITTGKEYTAFHGLFSSILVDGQNLRPDFGEVITELSPQASPVLDMRVQNEALMVTRADGTKLVITGAALKKVMDDLDD